MIHRSMLCLAVVCSAAGAWQGCGTKMGTMDSSRGVVQAVRTAGVDAGAQPPGSANAKKIGDPCVPSDGWQPEPAVPQVASSATSTAPETPSGFSIPTFTAPTPGTTVDSLPPGVGYCAQGPMFPNGSWTMTCRTNTDCSAGSVCINATACTKICKLDSDCKAPNPAGPGHCNSKVQVCQYPLPGPF